MVLELDVSGVSAMPDIDAVMTAETGLLDKDTVEFIAEAIEDADNIHDAISEVGDRMNMRESGEDQASVGDHWTTYPFEDFNLANVPQAFLDAYGDEDKAWDALVAYIKGGDVEPAVLANLTSQRRWIADFDEKRVLRITAFKPPWPKIMDNWWDDDDEDLTKQAERIQAAGYDIVTLDTIGNGGNAVQTTQVLWEKSKKAASGEFHGTSSDFVREAFPKLAIPDETPFPVTDPAEDDEEEGDEAE